MEDLLLQPREVVLHYGVLPPSVFAPQLDCVGSVQAARQGLAAVASTSSDGTKFVTCEDAASVLDMPVEHCQLLLDMIPAVSSKASSPAGGVDLHDLSLLLMAQLYKREAQKPETQDHWPEPASCSGGQADGLKGGAKGTQPGSPGGANNSRMLIKNQIQQQQKQQQACSRGYAEFLAKHQLALLELVMDDSSTAQAWQQQRAAQRQQQKAVQLQLHENQPQLQHQQSLQALPAAQQESQQQAAAAAAAAAGDDSEMTPAEETPPAAAAGGEEGQESMQSSPARPSSDDGMGGNQQQQQLQATCSLARSSTCSSISSSSIPPVSVSAVEFDRLGFLLEVLNHKTAVGAGSGGLTAAFAAAEGSVAPATPSSSSISSSTRKLSQYIPGYSSSSSLMMEEIVAWMNSNWVVQQQKPAAAAAALTPGSSGPTAAAAAAAPAAADLGSSPPAEIIMGSSPPGTSAASDVTMNGLLPAINTGTAAAATSPVTPSAGSSAAAAGSPVGLSSIRINTARGVVAVAGGAVDDRGVSGVYRGTVVRGPSDVTRDEITIQNCIECNIYILAPVKLARIYNCSDCSVCIGAVGSLLRVECCERLQLTAAAGQVVVVSCHSCCLHLGTPKQPALLGDCRFIKLAPYNTRYETLTDHLAAAGIPTSVPSMWDQPLIISCNSSSSSHGGGSGRSESGSGSGGGSSAAQLQQQRRPGCSTPSSPHTHGSSGGSSDRRSSGGAAAVRPVLLMQPEEFLPLVVPFRGTPGPLAGGSAHAASTQWVPGSHKQQQGPLPPLPFTLPPAFDGALQQHYLVVTELRNRIRGSGLDDGRRNQLQSVIQSYFREWLHSSGAIRQVYDLSKLEGDEVGPAGGSPPAALRDHSQL